MTGRYWAVQFVNRTGTPETDWSSNGYLWIGWYDSDLDRTLPPALAFRPILFKARREARDWVKKKNAEMLYWTNDPHYLRVSRVQVSIAAPPKINGRPV